MSNSQLPHRRYNPLTGEWAVISPQRANRPWQGAAPKAAPKLASYDPDCYLCPSNPRSATTAKGKKIQNPAYQDIFVFDNDFPALLQNSGSQKQAQTKQSLNSPLSHLFRQEAINGICRVICYSHLHDQHLGVMEETSIVKVIDEWINQLIILSEQHSYVQIFENKGEMVGCSSPHPHGQIWALDYEPHLVGKEKQYQQDYYEAHGSQLLLDYMEEEQQQQQRIITENQDWILLVPYWAYWPYETLLLPRRPLSSMIQLNNGEKHSLANILKKLVSKYDQLFKLSFPYMMGWHGSCKSDQSVAESGQLHCHFYPPLLDNIKRKYMAGFEVFAELQRDITPEQAAERLREV